MFTGNTVSYHKMVTEPHYTDLPNVFLNNRSSSQDSNSILAAPSYRPQGSKHGEKVAAYRLEITVTIGSKCSYQLIPIGSNTIGPVCRYYKPEWLIVLAWW